MKHSLHTAARRKGFTLVELLVVISILAVLMGLLIPAVFNLLSKGPQITTFAEIKQLEQAVQNFCRDYNVKFIPSKIKLGEKYTDYNVAGDQFDAACVAYLISLWPHIADAGGAWKGNGIDWNGNSKLDGPVILEGDQCLVFFLGGIPEVTGTAAVKGFAINQRDPSSNTGSRKGPHFDFKSDRLKPRLQPFCPTPMYYSYYDIHSNGDDTRDKPYAYFSSYGRRNQYGDDCPTIAQFMRDGQPVQVDITVQPPPQKLIPFAENAAPNRFQNPEGFQIISAGADRFFGWSNYTNGIWTPKIAEQAAIPNTGFSVSYLRDDQTNFYQQLMGNGQ